MVRDAAMAIPGDDGWRDVAGPEGSRDGLRSRRCRRNYTGRFRELPGDSVGGGGLLRIPGDGVARQDA
jgi:hypothetical protein